jgi:hypothetical protein
MSTDSKNLWEEVKANLRKLSACPKHKFPGGKVRVGERVRCENCGGEMGLSNIGSYIAGYEAAGMPADDIWPGYTRDRRKLQ